LIECSSVSWAHNSLKPHKITLKVCQLLTIIIAKDNGIVSKEKMRYAKGYSIQPYTLSIASCSNQRERERERERETSSR